MSADTHKMSNVYGQETPESMGQSWNARPILAFAVRTLVFVVPLVVALLLLRLTRGLFYRPQGWSGLVIWVAQVLPVGAIVAGLVGQLTRRALPLAVLLDLDLTFPGEAPSRLEIASNASTVKGVRERLSHVRVNGLGATESEAAKHALELSTLLSIHYASTRGRSGRVMHYADMIAQELGVPEQDRAPLTWGILLHDMGMLAIPIDILTKKGTLTSAERRVLTNHPTAGAELLSPLSNWLGDWVLAAGDHHERWDGTGYPFGLAGAHISLAGRIVAVADAYDAITSKRSYKQSMSREAARDELMNCSGTQFDPAVVQAFLATLPNGAAASGPLAQISQLGSRVFHTPALAALGAVIAVVGLVGIPPAPAPASLSFADDSGDVQDTTTSSTVAATTTLPITSTTSVAQVPASSSTSSSSTTRVTRPAPTSTTAPPTTNPPPTTSPPNNPTTTAAPATTTTTQPATTTTQAPTTTTTAPTPTISI